MNLVPIPSISTLCFKEASVGKLLVRASTTIRSFASGTNSYQLNEYILQQLSDEVLARVNMMRTFSIDRIVSHSYYCPRIFIQLCRVILLESEVKQNTAQEKNFLVGFTGGILLRSTVLKETLFCWVDFHDTAPPSNMST